MSSNSQSFYNGQQMQVNTNLTKLFPFNKEFIPYTINNSTYGDITLQAGTIMGVVTNTGLASPTISTSNDGSQNAMAILGKDYVVPAQSSITVSLMCLGYVRKDMVIFFNGTDTLSTVIGGKRVFETLLAAGVFLQNTRNATNYENQLS